MDSERRLNADGASELVWKRGCLEIFKRWLGQKPAFGLGSTGGRSSFEASTTRGSPESDSSSTSGKCLLKGRACSDGAYKRNGASMACKRQKGGKNVPDRESYAKIMCLSSSGKLLACGCANGSVLLWSFESETGS